MLGVGLAFLFTGMMVQKFFEKALRGIFKTYFDIIDVNDRFFQKTQQLRAGWEFFKFALVDALSQSGLFILLVDLAIQFVNWLGRLNPETLKFIGILLLIGFVVGTVMMLAGAAILFLLGPLAIVSFLIFLGLLAPFLFILVVIGILGLAVITLVLIWTSKLSKVKKLLLTLAVIIAVLALLFMLGVAPWILIAIAIGAVITLVFVFRKEISDAMKWVANSAQIASLLIQRYFSRAMDFIFDKFGKLLNIIGFDIPDIIIRQQHQAKIEADISRLRAEKEGLFQKEPEKDDSKFNIKEGVKDAMKDVMPNFQSAVTDGIKDSGMNFFPSTQG